LQGDFTVHWSPRTTDAFLDLGVGFNTISLGLRERGTIKITFGRFVTRGMMEAILDGRIPLRGELREVTVLLQDIRDFTRLSKVFGPGSR